MKYHEIVSQRNFEEYKRVEFPFVRIGHWGGDKLMFDEIFRGEIIDPNLRHAADVRDGSMAVLIGIAARKSIDDKLKLGTLYCHFDSVECDFMHDKQNCRIRK